MALKNFLSWSRDSYSISALANKSEKALIKEYNKLRRVANRRIEALGRSEFRSSDAYQLHKEGFPKASELKTTQLIYLLNSASRFLTARAGSVTGQREIRNEAINTLHEHGYTFVNKKNFRQFVDFMEETRTAAENSGLSSEEVAEFFDDMIKNDKRVSPETLKDTFLTWVGGAI